MRAAPPAAQALSLHLGCHVTHPWPPRRRSSGARLVLCGLLGAGLGFVGEWLLDGTHGVVDGAVLPAVPLVTAAGAA